jgi:flagellar hook-associated protein 1 FlgK
MAGGDLLGTSISGLLAFQRALATTGHNVANVNTPGYSRQRVDLVTRPPTPSGDGFIGNGVIVNTVERVIDQFIGGQLRSATAGNGQMQEFYRLASQIDNLLADPQAGLAPSLQKFFNAVNGLANDPSSIPARQVLMSESQSLADRFHYLYQRLETLRDGVNTEIRGTVDEINSLASSIAEVNSQIALSRGAAVGQNPNDLLDQRDELIRQLSERVAVTVVEQDDGSVNVFIGSGQTLVMGNTTNSLAAVNNSFDSTRLEVALVAGSFSAEVSDLLTGGKLGGVLQFRNDMLDSAQNELGRTAIALSMAFNDQHRLGIDLTNALGGDFFDTLDTATPRVLSSSVATVTASITTLDDLTTSDYRLDYDGATYSLVRLRDTNVVYSGAVFPPAVEVDGLTFAMAGAPAANDSWLIQPTRTGARDMALAITNVNQIAAAGPVRTAVATNANGVPTNLGTGAISTASVSTTTGLPLGANITLTFDSNAGGAGVPGFIVAGGPASPILYDPATQSDGAAFTFAGYGDMSFTISGVPQDGDVFVISNNTGAVSDNRNALSLAALRSLAVMDSGATTVDGSYSQLVVDVGTQTHRADINRNAQQTLLNRVTDERDSISGVNLDEEAANMQRFQQAYQAAAQLIGVADTLFQTLLGAVRR